MLPGDQVNGVKMAYGRRTVIRVPSLSPSGSWLSDAKYVSVVLFMVVTVNVTLDLEVLIFGVVRLHFPMALVVQAAEPE